MKFTPVVKAEFFEGKTGSQKPGVLRSISALSAERTSRPTFDELSCRKKIKKHSYIFFSFVQSSAITGRLAQWQGA